MKFTEEHKEKIRQAHLNRNVASKEAICEMAEKGMSAKEIATHFNKTTQAINKTLRKSGIKSVRSPNPKKGVSSKPEQIAIIVKMANEGKTRKEIAECVGVGHSRVCTILQEQGIILEKIKGNANPEKVEQICEMFRQGKTVTEITEYFGYSGTGGVCNILHRNGLRSRNPKINRPDGRTQMKEGYLGIKISDDDPYICMRTSRGEVLEHRYVMAKHLGRLLTATETVRHKNGNKEDNKIENLQLMSGRHGKGSSFNCGECKAFDIDSTYSTSVNLKCNKCGSFNIQSVDL
jgi:transposase